MDGVLRESGILADKIKQYEVSILVLMDGVLRAAQRATREEPDAVSILVLMDGVLRGLMTDAEYEKLHVSILVLMDGVLRAPGGEPHHKRNQRFNPCSNGWCTSSFLWRGRWEDPQRSFNPCSNGWCTSRARTAETESGERTVSILVLMDGVLRVGDKGRQYFIRKMFQSLF